jgi:hypothetical protein
MSRTPVDEEEDQERAFRERLASEWDKAQNAERSSFIRAAAIAIYAQNMKLISSEEAWAWAATLWANKPEDC